MSDVNLDNEALISKIFISFRNILLLSDSVLDKGISVFVNVVICIFLYVFIFKFIIYNN